MKDVDVPMGNAELRLTLASIESEIVETKGISIESRDASILTNGKVAEIQKWREQTTGGFKVAMGFLILVILPLAGWVLYLQSSEPQRVREEVRSAIDDKFTNVTPQ